MSDFSSGPASTPSLATAEDIAACRKFVENMRGPEDGHRIPTDELERTLNTVGELIDWLRQAYDVFGVDHLEEIESADQLNCTGCIVTQAIASVLLRIDPEKKTDSSSSTLDGEGK